MHKRLVCSAICWAFLFQSWAAAGDEVPKGFMPLFNGKDFAGWKATGKAEVWGAANGILFVQGGGGGWLLTENRIR